MGLTLGAEIVDPLFVFNLHFFKQICPVLYSFLVTWLRHSGLRLLVFTAGLELVSVHPQDQTTNESGVNLSKTTNKKPPELIISLGGESMFFF